LDPQIDSVVFYDIQFRFNARRPQIDKRLLVLNTLNLVLDQLERALQRLLHILLNFLLEVGNHASFLGLHILRDQAEVEHQTGLLVVGEVLFGNMDQF